MTDLWRRGKFSGSSACVCQRLAHVSDWQSAGRLLDIGCGDGAFMMLCRERMDLCRGQVSQGAAARQSEGHTVFSR